MRRGAIIALLVLAIAGVGPSAEGDLSSMELRRAAGLTVKGEKHLKAGSLEKALKLFDRAVEIAPGYPDAQLGVGHVAMRHGRFEEALDAYQRARDGYLMMSDAVLGSQRENYDSAQEQLPGLNRRLAVLEQQEAAMANLGGGWVRREIARVEREINLLENVQAPGAADQAEVPARIHFFVGNALWNLGREEEAMEAWRTCVREEPAFPLVYNNLAVGYLKIGRVDEARGAVARAEDLGLQVNPGLKEELARASDERLSESRAP
jgi:tetratricopeptide (TPR) repeat protein